MIYLKYCCFCVPLLVAVQIIALFDILLDIAACVIYILFMTSKDLANYMAVAFLILHALSCCLLICGSVKENPYYCQPFLAMTTVQVVLFLLLAGLDFCFNAHIFVISMHGVVCVLNCYFWWVVYSMYAFLGGDLIY